MKGKKSAVVDHGGASTGWLPRLVFYLKQRTKGANEINLIKGMMHLLASLPEYLGITLVFYPLC